VHSYRISGLSVASQMELPGAIEAPANDHAPDITVRLEAAPAVLADAIAGGPNWEMAGARVLLRVPRVGRFLIEDGRRIAVELEPGATPKDASLFVLGVSFGIVLHQRGAMVLHGSAVARDGAAMAICGQSGAGKSTLATALCRAGFAFVADDICAVTLDAEGRPVLPPDGRQLKLWRESIDRLRVTAEARGPAVRDGFEKYYIGPPSRVAAPPRLTAIYVLRDLRVPFEAGIEALNLPDSLRMLDAQAYRAGIRAKLGAPAEKLAQAAAVLGHAKVFIFTRPRGFDEMDAAVARLTRHWEGLAR